MSRTGKALALLTIAALSACGIDSPTAVSDAPSFATVSGSSDAIPDRYIIRLSDDVPSAAAASAAMMRGLRGEVHFTYETVFKGFAATLPGASLAAIQRNPLVASIEADGVVTKVTTTQSGATWGLDRIDARSGLDQTYSYGATGAGVDAYILDTGILSSHTDFGGRVLSGYTSVSDGRGTEDCDGHGTHVAGTVGGTQWGVGKGVNLIPVRVLDCSGSGTWSGVIAGMDWVAANASGPSVANMSLGGGQTNSIDDAVARMHNAGVTVVVAAGNSDADACGSSPAAAPEAITVGATTSSDARASYSNFGTCLDIFAPGSSITSAWYTGNTATSTISGTSMASPHVAGAAALWLETDPNMSPAQVANALTSSATEGAVSGADGRSGRGRNATTVPSPNLLLYVDPAMNGGGGGGGGGGNSAPTASFTYSCTDLSCDFTGSGSDSDGTVASYAWSFGSSAQNASFTFPGYGTYTVTLTVTDNEGATGSSTQTVTLADPNPPAISLDLVRQYKQRGTPLADFAYSGATTVDLYSVSGGQFGSPVSGGSFTVQFPKGGGSYDIYVCETGTTNCSNTVTVVW